MRCTLRVLGAFAIGTLLLPAAASAQGTDVTIEAVMARDVVDRMPVDSASTFPADVGKVFVWTRVAGAAGSTLSYVWIHGPHETSAPLQIGGSPWRTWSSRNIPVDWTGAWRVEVRNSAGDVLKTVAFTIGE